MQDIKRQIIAEIDDRMERLKQHRDDRIVVTGNQYEELNQALSKVIGVPLIEELDSLKSYVQQL
ncbi:hypothetical protein [Candidatus Soleaferrea massiliensis]|uniref:hypothetical protein n=1 Tax=Candidatus Soleaferrea massiliensis TaxID=1470354 RepID=UPI00059183F3|nr:hypothetical protein [Candidatus Soleaferrea massiliensis]